MRKEPKIKGLEIHNIEIEIKGDVTEDQLNVGGLYFETTDGKRDAIFDTTSGYIQNTEATGEEFSRVTMGLFRDDETFADAKHNLKADDLLDANHDSIKVRLWFEEMDFEVVNILLHFNDDEGQDYQLECEVY